MRFSTRAATAAISATAARPARGAFAKHEGAIVARARKDPVGHDDVKVHKAAQRPVETLHEGDGARLAMYVRSALLPARDFLHEEAALRGQRVRPERVYAADFMGRRQHPLPHRDVRWHVSFQAGPPRIARP